MSFNFDNIKDNRDNLNYDFLKNVTLESFFEDCKNSKLRQYFGWRITDNQLIITNKYGWPTFLPIISDIIETYIDNNTIDYLQNIISCFPSNIMYISNNIIDNELKLAKYKLFKKNTSFVFGTSIKHKYKKLYDFLIEQNYYGIKVI